VLCLDADEFVDDRAMALPDVLAAVPAGELLIKAPMVVYHATERDDPGQIIVPVRLRERLSGVRAFKAIVRGVADRRVVIDAGGHDVLVDGAEIEPWGEARGLRWAHYPERSPWQYVSKIVIGWCKALAVGKEAIENNYSHHYGGAYGWLKDDPAHIFRNPRFLAFRNDPGDLVGDPIDYKGGSLRHTPAGDPQMRMVRVMADYFDQLATRHGMLLDEVPGARDLTSNLNSQIRVLFGNG
jgi:hypothetical protein